MVAGTAGLIRINKTFGYGERVWLNACVGRNGGPYDFADYAWGYFAAAKEIIDGCREHSMLVDVLVYPTAFTYRHAVELSIKNLGQKLPRIWGEQAPTRWTHRLIDNWTTVADYLRRDRSFDSDGELIPALDELIQDLLEIDHKGEVFRYPKSKDGAAYLQNQSLINFDRLYTSITSAEKIFSWWNFQADTMWEALCEQFAASR